MRTTRTPVRTFRHTAAGAIACVALLAGCASGDASTAGDASVTAAGTMGSGPADSASLLPPPASTSRGAPEPTPPSDAQVVEIRFADGKVDAPGRVQVKLGTTVRLVVTSDVADEVHVHAPYDLEFALAPGEPATEEFLADQAGLVEVETHETHTVLTQLVIR